MGVSHHGNPDAFPGELYNVDVFVALGLSLFQANLFLSPTLLWALQVAQLARAPSRHGVHGR